MFSCLLIMKVRVNIYSFIHIMYQKVHGMSFLEIIPMRTIMKHALNMFAYNRTITVAAVPKINIVFVASTHAAQESRVSPAIIAAGSASGVVIICIILAPIAVISVVVCLKRRQKLFHLTANVAYSGQCTKEDINYYTISQP